MPNIPRLSAIVAGAVALTALAVTHTELRPLTAHKNLAGTKTAAQTPRRTVRTVRAEKPVIGQKTAPERFAEPTFTPGLPVIYGSVVSSYGDWFVVDKQEQLGYYAFQPESNIKFQPIAVHPNLFVNGGGAYSDRRLHYHLWEMYPEDGSETGIVFNNYYCVVNTDTWSFANLVEMHDEEYNIAYDMTYDPTTQEMYAILWGPYENGYCDFARIDKMTGMATQIAKIPVMSVLAADNFGRLFTVGSDGNTYYIDKNDGSLTLIGASGIKPRYIQSATVDPETNDIYWAALSDEKGGQLCRLNTFTGKAELIGNMPDDEEITGLFIEAQRKGLNAPDELVNCIFSYANGKSNVSATIPAKAFDGSALSGTIYVDMYMDGALKDTKSGNPGSTVNFSVAASDGAHSVVLAARNSVGSGPKTFKSQWCGPDSPAAVTDLNFTLDGNTATLTWNAPAQGLNGGTIDPSKVKYTVKRFPGEVLVADKISETSFTETLPDGIATYYYTVTTSNEVGEGGTVLSNSNFMGNAFTVPYFQPFDTEESLDGFTIFNSEEDRGWYWWHNTVQNFQCMAHKFTLSNAADSWLILPAIQFDKSSKYALRFTARVFDDESPERFEVKMGQGATVDAQRITLMPVTTIMNEDAKRYEIPFTVEADGTWNISFHCVSSIKSYYLLIDDVEVVATATAEGPAACTDLTATPAANGALRAMLNFTLPTHTYSGNELSAISKVCIYRGETDMSPIAEITSGLTPGGKCSWTDENAVQGENIYRVAAYSGDAKGVEATVSVYVGYDTPMPVTNAKAVDKDGNNVLVTWNAPTKGVNGGDLKAGEITYKVYANTGDVLADGIKDTSFIDDRFIGVENQYFVYYQIHAQYGGMESEGTLTDFIVMGPDNAVPFTESFKEAGLEHTPWTLTTIAGNVTGCWGIAASGMNPTVTPQDEDGGFAYFKGADLPSGCSARMTSPKVDLFNADHPVLSFWVYMPGSSCRESLDVEITHNDNVYTKLETIDLTADETGWKQFKVAIPRRHCTESTMVAFKATAGGYGKNICVDNIAIVEDASAIEYDTDLEAVSIEIPEEFMPGETREFTVSVYNNGRNTVSDYTVTLLCDGQNAMSTKGTELAPGDVVNYIFKATADESDRGVTYRYAGKVTAAGDENPLNDVTEEKSITIGVAGVDGISADAMQVFASREGIVVVGANGKTVNVYDLEGKAIATADAAGRTVINVPQGIYMVRVAGRAYKVLVP